MKKHFIVLTFLLFTVLSCQTVEKDPAHVTAMRFLDYFHKKKFEHAEVFLDTHSFDEFYGYLSYLDLGYDSLASKFKIDTIIYTSQKDTATIHYSWDKMKKNEHTLRMAKQDKQWRVLFSRSDPAAIAEKFLEAFYAGDTDRAKKYVAPHSYKDLEFLMEHDLNADTGRQVQVKIKKVEWNNEDGKAVVHYKEADNRPVKLNLVKLNDIWRVNLTLDKLNGYEKKFYSYSRDENSEGNNSTKPSKE